jgi:hypothetical protein
MTGTFFGIQQTPALSKEQRQLTGPFAVEAVKN